MYKVTLLVWNYKYSRFFLCWYLTLLPRALPAVVHAIAIDKHKILTKTLDKRVLVYYLCTIELFSILLGHSKQTSILEVGVCFIYVVTARCRCGQIGRSRQNAFGGCRHPRRHAREGPAADELSAQRMTKDVVGILRLFQIF